MSQCIVIVLRIGMEPIPMEVRVSVSACSRLRWSKKDSGDNEQAAPESTRNGVLLQRSQTKTVGFRYKRFPGLFSQRGRLVVFLTLCRKHWTIRPTTVKCS